MIAVACIISFISGLVLSPWISPKIFMKLGAMVGYIAGVARGIRITEKRRKTLFSDDRSYNFNDKERP